MLKKIVCSELLIPVAGKECFDDTCSLKPHGFQLKHENNPTKVNMSDGFCMFMQRKAI